MKGWTQQQFFLRNLSMLQGTVSALLKKTPAMLVKQDGMLEKQDLHIEITRNGFNDVKNEIKDVKNEINLQRDDFKEMFMREVNELHIYINDIKATLARMQAAG